MDRHLGGVRAGDEICRAERIEELLVVHPFATLYHFIMHHANVRSGTSKPGNAEFEEKGGNFCESL